MEKLHEVIWTIGMQLICNRCGKPVNHLTIDVLRKEKICDECLRKQSKENKADKS